MAYHETYWVAIATAAPVIALANTLAVTTSIQSVLHSNMRLLAWQPLGALVQTIGLVVVFLSQAAALGLALTSLGDEVDATSPGIVTTIEVAALLLVLYVVAVFALTQPDERARPRSEAAEEFRACGGTAADRSPDSPSTA